MSYSEIRDQEVIVLTEQSSKFTCGDNSYVFSIKHSTSDQYSVLLKKNFWYTGNQEQKLKISETLSKYDELKTAGKILCDSGRIAHVFINAIKNNPEFTEDIIIISYDSLTGDLFFRTQKP